MNRLNSVSLHIFIVFSLMFSGCTQESSDMSITESESSITEPSTAEVIIGPVGSWDVRWESVSMTHSKTVPMYAELEISDSNGHYTARFNEDNVPITIDNNKIEFSYNETLRGETGFRMGQVSLEFSGIIDGNSMRGTIKRIDGIMSERNINTSPEFVKHTEGAAPGFHPLTLAQAEMLPVTLHGISDEWSSTRIVAGNNPANLDGVWMFRPEMVNDWLEDFNLLLTDEARQRKREWKPYDDPALRCASAGAVRISGWPLPIDIVQSDRIVAILHEGESVYRRIHTDGRKMPEDWIESGMGYSVGEWKGDTLEVETAWLNANEIGGFGLQHRGEKTVMTEKIRMTSDGKFIRIETTLTDPLTWTQPLRRITVWERDMAMEFVPYECDGYTFFKGLHADGTDDEYFSEPAR